eukprot:TRINITY_DN2873_c0_g1_i1.p1 TRINITY_DN2873_c0_g1~~TRINITY_DN2873_c0_g1_i1.p1  ORF type:complete len:529 (+),score=46.59 TRINITY_DN2873_c0_g1_i1:62-1588(+)
MIAQCCSGSGGGSTELVNKSPDISDLVEPVPLSISQPAAHASDRQISDLAEPVPLALSPAAHSSEQQMPDAKSETSQLAKEKQVATISRATSVPKLMRAASQRSKAELVGVATLVCEDAAASQGAVCEDAAASQTRASHWDRMKAINVLKLKKIKAGESLAEVREQMVGRAGPPLPEEVGDQCCCLCCCFFCCPCRASIRRCFSTKPEFVDERTDRSWKSIAFEFLHPETLFWIAVCIVIFCGWGYISWITYPTAMSMMEHNACMYWSMLYLDFFPNVLTALIYHQCRCCHRLHKAEHQYVFQSPLKAQFSVGSAYFLYFNCWTAPMYVLTVIPSFIARTHYQSAIFYATLVQTVILLCIRIVMWIMEQRPSMYMYAPTCWLNFMRFFRTHFTIAAFDYYNDGRYKGWTRSTGYGNVMPFFDVCLGSCPFDVKWSVPIPFIDFITHEAKVWSNFVDPENIFWTPLQKLWYFSWLFLIAVLTTYVFSIFWAPWGSCWPWGPVSVYLGGQ